MEQSKVKNNGSACAAILASGIGCFILGVILPLSEAVISIKNFLNLWNPVGPLSGKALVATISYLVSWIILHNTWKGKQLNFGLIFTLTLILIGLGFVGTFPPFFELFTAH